MLNLAKRLPTAAQVTEKLIRRYGGKLWQVEQLSEHIFRGWMNDGAVVLATVAEDGSMSVREANL